MRDLWLAGTNSPTAGSSSADGSSEDEPAVDEATTTEGHTTTQEHVTGSRPLCVPRSWYGPSWKRHGDARPQGL